MSEIFEALGSPERRRILSLLKEKGAMNAGEIAASFSLTKPTLSHHLKILTDAGLLEREKRGNFVYFSLNLSVMQEAVQILFDLMGVKASAARTRGAKGAEESIEENKPDGLESVEKTEGFEKTEGLEKTKAKEKKR